MSTPTNKTFSEKEKEEIRRFIKEQTKKLKKEGSTTAGVPGYQTPAAFSGEEDGEGTSKVDLTQGQFAYSIKAPKKKKHFVKLQEISYKAFKEDNTVSEVQKVNQKILEVSKTLREISRAMDHSIKLKQESNADSLRLWKRTNEAIDKIKRRVAEINSKAGRLAGLQEKVSENIEQQIVGLFGQAGISLSTRDVEYVIQEAQFDIQIEGEPYAFNYDNGNLVYEGYDKDEPLGNIHMNPNEVVNNIKRVFNKTQEK